MSPRFITVKRSDPEFDQYITGAFSSTERAIPMGSMNIRSKSSFVTFKIISSAESERPNLVRVIWEGMRPKLLTITVAPVAITLMLLSRGGHSIDWIMATLCFSALVFMHLSVFLLNDFFDHYRGRDQINRSKGSRIIQRGWATAKAVRFWGLFNLGIGIALGLPALIQKPLIVAGIGGLAVFIILGYSNLKKGLRETGVGELLVSMSLGPLLVTGVSLTVSDEIPLNVLAMGIVFGWMSSLVFQLKNLEEMVTTYQNRGSALIQRMGFDRGKKFIQLQLMMLPILALVGFQFVEMRIVLSLCTVPLFLSCYWLKKNLRQADSPMSSVLSGIADEMALIHLKNAIFFSVLLFPPVL